MSSSLPLVEKIGTPVPLVSMARVITNFILEGGDMVNDTIRYDPPILSTEDQAAFDKENAEDEGAVTNVIVHHFTPLQDKIGTVPGPGNKRNGSSDLLNKRK